VVGAADARLDIADTTSLEEALDRIAAFARGLPEGAWLLGGRFDKNSWGRWPTAVDLDGVTAGHPAVLRSRDGHSRWLNSAAIARAGITRDTAVPDGGAIFRDDRGEATGVLQENANGLADAVIPAPTEDEMLADARRGQSEAWRRGITGLEDLDQFMGRSRSPCSRGCADAASSRSACTWDPARAARRRAGAAHAHRRG
jgi:predicted amidohydrolase YtcJ